MYKGIQFIYIIISCFSIISKVNSQNLSGSDSLLIKKYWNRINIQSITSKSNTFYVGIDNYFQLIYPDKNSSTFRYYLKTNNGDLYEYDETSFLVLPQNIGRIFISVNIVTDDGDTLLIGKKNFSVINLPYPTLKLGNSIIKEQGEVDKKIFYTHDTLKVYFTDDIPESSNWYKIERFSIGYAYGKIYMSTDNNGPVLSEESINLLNKVRPGWELNIKVNSVNPSGLLKNLPLVKFRAL